MVVRAEQERVRLLLKEAIPMLCKNGLSYNKEFCIEALVGITLDQNDVFLVSIKETVKSDYLDSDGGDSLSQSAERTLEVNITKQPVPKDKLTSPKSGNKFSRKRRRSKINNKETPGVLNLESDSDGVDDGLPNTEDTYPYKKEKHEIDYSTSSCRIGDTNQILASNFEASNESLVEREPSLTDSHSSHASRTINRSDPVSNTEDSKLSNTIIIKDEPITDEYLSNLNFGELSNKCLDFNDGGGSIMGAANLPYAQGSADMASSTSGGPSVMHMVPNVSQQHQDESQDGPNEGQQMLWQGKLYNHSRNQNIYKTSQQPPKFLCPFCGKPMRSAAYLKMHISSFHLHEMKYKCKECNARYRWNSSLRKHMLTHKRQKQL